MLNAKFIDASNGQILVISWQQDNKNNPVIKHTQDRDVLLVLPSIAEELNCGRHHIASLGMSLQSHQIDTFTIDYFGTGDSSGDFYHINMHTLLQDVETLLMHVSTLGYRHIHLLGLRFGGRIITSIIENHHFSNLFSRLSLNLKSIIFWGYIENTEAYISQIFRTKIAQSLINGKKLTKLNIYNELKNKGKVEISGYWFSSIFIKQIKLLPQDLPTEKNMPQIHQYTFNLSQRQSQHLDKKYDSSNIKIHHTDILPFWMVPDHPVSTLLIEQTCNNLLAT